MCGMRTFKLLLLILSLAEAGSVNPGRLTPGPGRVFS